MGRVPVIFDKTKGGHNMSKAKYQKVTIEAAKGGWIVTVKGNSTPQLCFQWRQVINILESELTSKGDSE